VTRILVVEDDPNTRDGLIELLQDEGYQVAGVQTGQSAIEKVSAAGYDIVLIDYSLPDIDGLEVCRQLREQSGQIVLILITGYFNTRIMNAAKKYHISKIFTKPLVLDELFDKLGDCSVQVNTTPKN
jgi:CheY-like chemotaxis protein